MCKDPSKNNSPSETSSIRTSNSRSLSEANRKKVVVFGDVDVNKIGTHYENPLTGVDIPIVHYSELKPPVVCCVALGRTAGVFEDNVKSMCWECGKDYWYFN